MSVLVKEAPLLFIDSFDSFTYNLVQAFQQLSQPVVVVNHHELTPQECLQMRPSHLVIGPGPGHPKDAGMIVECIRYAVGKVPILGVCLGHQAIAEAFGGKVVRAKRVMHGKCSPIIHDSEGGFSGLPQKFLGTRYHSLLVDLLSLPSCLEVSAFTLEGEIMGLRHKYHSLEGIQFHPESIASEYGLQLLANFLKTCPK